MGGRCSPVTSAPGSVRSRDDSPWFHLALDHTDSPGARETPTQLSDHKAIWAGRLGAEKKKKERKEKAILVTLNGMEIIAKQHTHDPTARRRVTVENKHILKRQFSRNLKKNINQLSPGIETSGLLEVCCFIFLFRTWAWFCSRGAFASFDLCLKFTRSFHLSS